MGDVALSVLAILDSRDAVAEIEKSFSQDTAASQLDVVWDIAQARSYLSQATPDVVLARYRLPDGLGTDLLKSEFYPLVLLVEADQQELAEHAVRDGCMDYLVSNAANLAVLPKLLSLERQLWLDRKKIDQAERLTAIAFWEWDEVSDRLTSFSEGYGRLMEMTREEVVEKLSTAKGDLEYIHPDDRATFLEAEAIAIERGEGVDVEYRILTKSGRVRHVREVGEPMIDESGWRVSHSGVYQDITDYKLLQQRLARSLADSQLAARLAKLGTYEWDWINERLISCSEEYARVAELTVEEAIEKFTSCSADNALIHPDDLAGFKAIESEAIANAKGYTAEYRMVAPSGHIRHVREITEVEVDDQGQVVRTVGCLQDVSEQVHLQEQLRQAQKLEAVGRLAGGIAHDFNNLLTAIGGYTEILLDSFEIDDPVHQDLSAVQSAADQATALTRQLLAFSRKQILQPEVIDMGAIVGHMESMLHRLLGEHIELTVRRDPGLRRVLADPGQIEQVVMNLVVNARDAMPQGGSIKVSIENISFEIGAEPALPDLPSGDSVMLSVADTGIGMREETRSHVFEPFYTTKGIDEGTGLGLSTVFGIVKQSGGTIEVESELNAGSTFRVYLPAVAASEPDAEPSVDVASELEGRETIMVVEDDDRIRGLLDRTLKLLGYTVIVASHGVDAVQTAASYEAPIDLLITDVVMPHMSGHELAERLTQLRPELSILYISGHSDELVAKQGFVHLEIQFLQKPFRPTALAAKVREILDSPASTPASH